MIAPADKQRTHLAAGADAFDFLARMIVLISYDIYIKRGTARECIRRCAGAIFFALNV
jgi:hypothetical protein